MNEQKANKVTIRLSDEERVDLEIQARNHGLSLSQYMRYKLLEAQESETLPSKADSNAPSIKFLDEHLPLLGRVILDGYFHIIRMAEKKLTREEMESVENEAVEVINRLGIAKPDVD